MGDKLKTALCLAATLIAGQACADSVSDRIRDLSLAVPFEAVNASPQDDILAHIAEMGRRRAAPATEFAVPDLDLETLMKSQGASDVLMDPRILEAISRMPADRAAQVLRLIEDRRAGLNPLQDVPSLSLRDDDSGAQGPQSLALRGWVLDRDTSGAPFIQNGQDSASRILIVPSMILGDLGRVVAVQDDVLAFRLTLESGDVLEGEPLRPIEAESGASALDASPQGDPGSASSGAGSDGASGATGIDGSLRPKARPEGLAERATAIREKAAVSEPVAQSSDSASVVKSLRPRLRPAGLGLGPAPTSQENDDAT